HGIHGLEDCDLDDGCGAVVGPVVHELCGGNEVTRLRIRIGDDVSGYRSRGKEDGQCDGIATSATRDRHGNPCEKFDLVPPRTICQGAADAPRSEWRITSSPAVRALARSS